jgi:hypothetical protein
MFPMLDARVKPAHDEMRELSFRGARAAQTPNP